MWKPQCFSHIGGQTFNIQIQGRSEVTILSVTASLKTCSATYWLCSLQKDISLSLCTSVFSKGPDYSWHRNISTEINLGRFWKLASYPPFLLKNPEFYETELKTFDYDLRGFCHPYLQGFCEELHFSILICMKISPFGFQASWTYLPCADSSAQNSLKHLTVKHLLHFLMLRNGLPSSTLSTQISSPLCTTADFIACDKNMLLCTRFEARGGKKSQRSALNPKYRPQHVNIQCT